MIKPGGSHTLTCRGSGFTFSDYAIHWIRQNPSGGLQWIALISKPTGSTKEYHDSVKDRFAVSRDNSISQASLKMDNLKTEDTGKYYCARYTVIKKSHMLITKPMPLLLYYICRWQYVLFRTMAVFYFSINSKGVMNPQPLSYVTICW